VDLEFTETKEVEVEENGKTTVLDVVKVFDAKSGRARAGRTASSPSASE